MPVESDSANGIVAELRIAWRHAGQVWKLVSHRDKLALVGAALVSCVFSSLDTLISALLGRLVDVVPRLGSSSAHVFFTTVSTYLASIAALYVFAQALQVARKLVVQNTATRIERDRIAATVAHLLRVDLSSLSFQRVGALQGRIGRDVEGFVKFIKIGFHDFVPALAAGLASLIGVFALNWKVGLLMSGVLPVSLLLVVRQMMSQKGIRLELMRSRSDLEATVGEQLGGIEYVRAANTHPQESKRIEHMAELRRGKEFKHHKAMALFDCAKSLNEGFFLILVIALSISLARRQEMSYGAIVAVSLLFQKVTSAMREMHRILDEAHESSLRVGDLLSLMALPVDRSFGQVTLREPALDPQVPIVIAENLSVDYKTSEGQSRRVLNQIGMTVHFGETIGAAGPSGSGKSTWLRVLMRLIHPATGRVLVGGVPLESLSRDSIGKLVGYVSQNPFLFSGTVAENIAYGIANATRDAVIEAAKRANIHDEILSLPGGYDAQLTERGTNLSGGQRQRIAIARIFLKNPPLMILDEGTSALDNISEREVQRAIEEARADRTVIMVAHRLSTLRDADRIFVFDQGRIVEIGSYDELVELGGVFTRLVRSAENN
jgi:ATP-binding cassette subfamily B protein